MIELTRWSGIWSFSDSSDCVISRGLRNSSSRISPGWLGGRFFGSMRILLVVIRDLDLLRVAVREPENHAELVVHSYAPISSQTALQLLKTVRRSCRKIHQVP